jgi:hypothetical protein
MTGIVARFSFFGKFGKNGEVQSGISIGKLRGARKKEKEVVKS